MIINNSYDNHIINAIVSNEVDENGNYLWSEPCILFDNKLIKSISKKWNQIKIKLNCEYKNPPKVKTIAIQDTLGSNITDDKAIEIIVK